MGTLNGRFIKHSLDTRNLEHAVFLIRQIEAGKAQSVKIEEACERFITEGEVDGLSDETLRKRRLLMRELGDAFAGKGVEGITADDVARFREGWKLKAITARKKIERLRSFFKFCIRRKWITENPASGLRLPKEGAVERKPFEKEELERITWAIALYPDKSLKGEYRNRIRAFIAILRWTGLRIGDVAQLPKSAISSDLIILRTHKNQKPIKLPLHPEIKEALEKVTNPGDFWFWSGLGNPASCIGDWQRMFRRLSALSGVHIHAHRWRHNFATDLLSKGVPVSEVAAILGNSTRIVEKHYAQWIQARQDALEKAVKATWA
jgi:site-specific recombinase XerD